MMGTVLRPVVILSGAFSLYVVFGIASPAILHGRTGCEEPADVLQYPKEENLSKRNANYIFHELHWVHLDVVMLESIGIEEILRKRPEVTGSCA